MADLALVSERVGEIRELPGECQQLRCSEYPIAVPGRPAPYNAVSLWPESTLERYTQ